MLEIQLAQIQKLVNVLDGVGAEYKINLPDGTSFGKLEVAKKQRKAAPMYPYGSVRRLFKGIVDDLDVGKAAIINGGKFDLNKIASNITSYTNIKYGKGTFATKIMRDTHKVQVVRLS